MAFRITAAFILTAVVAACSDPKAASERNFQEAIQGYLNASYPKCYVVADLPVTIFQGDDRRTLFQALANAGVLSESNTQAEFTGIFGNKALRTATVFSATDEGKKYYSTSAVKAQFGDRRFGGFCLGKATVKEIKQYSEPADRFGQRISRVNHTYEVVDIPQWAKVPELVAMLGDLKVDIQSERTPADATAVMILTNKGWVHEKLFEK